MTIVTLTMNPTLDKSASIEHVIAEQKLRCHTLRHEPGGGGINVSRAIRKLGGQALTYYTSGGANGQILEALLDQDGLDHHHPFRIADSSREGLTVFEEATGQQYRFNLPGPTLQKKEWQHCLDELSKIDPAPDYVVASGSLPQNVPTDFYAQVSRLTQEFDAKFILDTSTTTALQAALEEGVYLIKPNLREFRELANSKLEDEAEQEAFASEIVQQGKCEAVVLSLGAAGVLLMTPHEGCQRLRAPTVPIESKVGAGDSTVAGIVLSLQRGKSLRDAVRFGVAAGAAAVMTSGTELCRREDTERLFTKIQDG